MNYKKAYFQLFNDMTDILEKIKKSQQKAEEILISDENKIISFDFDKE